ncbi:hypothetical protein EAH72_30740 [Pseudomonas caspiana]|nr:hypothetical protein EAH72_30740 [Pseudomonas caspiana]
MAMLSHHALDALNAKETQGNEQEKTLARFAKQAIGSGLLQISSNQPAVGGAQFGMESNQDLLVIKAKLNERSEYDVLSVGFRRGSQTPVSMTLPSPSTAVAGTARPRSALLNLPNELLLKIAGSTRTHGEGVNLSLRRVSKQMKVIADDQLSPKQRFLVENAPTLHATAGYDGNAISVLARLTPAQQSFALTNGPTLHATAGYDGNAINGLSTQVPAQQSFALTNGPTLHATAGYDGNAISVLAKLTPAQQSFALTNGPTLHATAGYDGNAINGVAASQR